MFLSPGLSVHVTLQVSPPPQQFREFIEAAGGTFVPKIPTAAHQVSTPLQQLQHFTTLYNFLTTSYTFDKLATNCNTFCQLFDNYWQLFATFGNYCKLFAVLTG